jgi:hypothetical protein
MSLLIYEQIYRPLEAASIHLLSLLPGTRGSKIHCTLSHVPLDICTMPYETLSCVLGPAEPCNRIYLEGCPFVVRANAMAALKVLRYEDHPRTLWIDSICINQDDKQEQGHQV